ncbi:MAG: hypothetical protein ACTSPD_07615 [Promethearchaeota archaeon]
MPNSNVIINDKFLVNYFKKHIKDAVFLTRKKNQEKIINILKEIFRYEKELEQIKEKEFPFGFVPKEQQEKIKKIHELWEILLKEAIYTLRKNDIEDQHDFKQDFGIIEIRKYFKEFSEFEDILYGSVKYYREHSLHVIRVFLLGFYLLNNQKFANSRDVINFNNIEIFSKSLKSENDQKDLEDKQAIWTIIALTHDLGYPIQKISNINEKIRKIIEYYGPSGIEEFKYRLPLQNQNLNNFILEFISSKLKINKQNNNNFYSVIQNKFYLKFSKAFEEFNHGIMSCILLMKHLVYFKESDYSHSHLSPLNRRDARQFQIRWEILRAIASHDNQDIYHVYPTKFPFILTICDDMQEWDRPILIRRFESRREIKINSFNKKEINYEQLFPKNKDMKLEINDLIYFATKIKKYIKLFRSGPNSYERPFKFVFSYNFLNNNDPDKAIIKFEYFPDTNKYPSIISPLLNDNKNYLNIFLEYIENDFNENEEINNLIKKINNKFF